MRTFVLLLLAAITLSGCDSMFQKMEATEHGIKFHNLPPFLGGGIARDTVAPGQLVFLLPWDTLIRVNTASQDVTLGEGGEDQKELGDFLFTRALDGNEVALRMTVRYQIKSDSDSLRKVVQQVGTSNESIRDLVLSTARAMIRSDMNALTTAHFLNDKDRYDAVKRVEDGLRADLGKQGINVLAVILDRFEFARLLQDGSVDKEYQEKLNETQRKREETERERLRIDTVRADGQQRFNQTQAAVNRQLEEAKGVKTQIEQKGAAYLEAKTNEANAILIRGQAEVQGMIEKINSLSGPGGQAILRLEIARSIRNAGAKFVVLNEGKGGGNAASLDVNRVNVNQLLQQAGIAEALSERAERNDLQQQEGTKE